MTENKRFTYKHFDWLQWHIYKDGEFFIEVTNCEEDAKKLCELLNGLHEENNGFKIHEEFKNKAYSDLLDSFTQLKKKYQKSKKENKELKKENEQLKQLLKSINSSFTFDDNYVSWFEDCVIVSKEGLKEISLGSDFE